MGEAQRKPASYADLLAVPSHCVGELVDGERRLMGDHAGHIGSADLGPQNGLHVVANRGDGESGEPVDAPADPLDVALFGQLDEADLMQAGRPRLGGGEVASLIFGDAVDHRIPLSFWHDRRWQQFNVCGYYCQPGNRAIRNGLTR